MNYADRLYYDPKENQLWVVCPDYAIDKVWRWYFTNGSESFIKFIKPIIPKGWVLISMEPEKSLSWK
jgi:hypothetical protein